MSIRGSFRVHWRPSADPGPRACANQARAQAEPWQRSNDLVGTVWVLDAASTSGLVGAVPLGARVTLSFADTRAHGTAACHSYGGAYRASEDGSLSFDAFAVTLMACAQPLMTLESAYLDVLAGVSSFEIGGAGDLTLSNGQSTLTFSRAVHEPLPLVGTTWILSSISSGTSSDVISDRDHGRVLDRPRWADRVQWFQRSVYNGRRLAVVLAPRDDEAGVQEVRHGAGTRLPRRDEPGSFVRDRRWTADTVRRVGREPARLRRCADHNAIVVITVSLRARAARPGRPDARRAPPRRSPRSGSQ